MSLSKGSRSDSTAGRIDMGADKPRLSSAHAYNMTQKMQIKYPKGCKKIRGKWSFVTCKDASKRVRTEDALHFASIIAKLETYLFVCFEHSPNFQWIKIVPYCPETVGDY
jgi:hypothetical protein